MPTATAHPLQPPPSADATPAFAFGKNWQRFLRCYTDERVRTAEASLREFMRLPDLRGKTFIDIGCGSGLFSLAAHNLGAARVVSLDVDPFSVACARHFHEKSGRPSHWQVLEGSALDEQFLAPLGTFDIVYSWGVLHHTGDMWRAIANAASMVSPGPGSLFYIAIYNKVQGARGSKFWHRVKKRYAGGSRPLQKLMEWTYFGYFYQSKLLRFKSPWRSIREYQSKRGMDWKTDMIDWLGGYPYEYATVQEIFAGVREQHPDFGLTNLSQTAGLGTNSFLFERR